MEVGGPGDGGGSSAEEQEKLLADAIALVQHDAFYMHRALDGNNLREALKYSAQMLSELRTSKLSPQKYYELYMRLFDELRRLEIFFQDETKRGRTPADLYELVQHAGNILPRLYLLCTVGSVYIMSKEAPAKDVLKDLVEMSRGVQHPIRGLFLRNYLTQISRGKLPDVGSPFEGEGGNVMDAVEFVLQNFTEMNKLWVRMQHQGPAREKEKREKERSELRDLVGKNLHVLSQLEGVDLEMYKDVVLPRVLEQIVNCKDEIAQYYLMDCVIQVFPDDFHLQTLETLLSACPQLQPLVDVKNVMSELMERLSKYATASPEVLPDFHEVEAFSKFSHIVVEVIEAQPDMPLAGAISLHVALLTFVLSVHSDHLEYVDQVLGSCVKRLEGKGRVKDVKATKQLVSLLSAPLEKYKDMGVILKLGNYAHVMKHLDHDTNKSMAVVLIQSVLSNYILISEPDKVDALLDLLRELVQDSGGTPSKYNDEDFKEEQNLIARLVHMLSNDDLEVMFQILEIARRHFGLGGPHRMQYTLPPLVFSTLKLVHVLQKKGLEEGFSDRSGSLSLRKVFQFLHHTVESLAMIPAAELALRLYLQCAEAAGNCGLEPVAYEFYTQAFLLYEEEISDSRAQVTALHLIIGTLQRTRVFGVENRDTLTHKATGYSSKLLKKPDQCRAVVSCSHLFWVEGEGGVRDGERVILCLKRALRIANAAQQMSSATRGTSGPMTLFVEILNTYLYYFDKAIPQITSTVIQGLVELIVTEAQSEGSSNEAQVDPYLANTLRYIQYQKQKGDTTAERLVHTRHSHGHHRRHRIVNIYYAQFNRLIMTTFRDHIHLNPSHLHFTPSLRSLKLLVKKCSGCKYRDFFARWQGGAEREGNPFVHLEMELDSTSGKLFCTRCIYTVETLYQDYFNRREALVDALTASFPVLQKQCDPSFEAGAVCLYGFPNRRWVVRSPSESLLPPEPYVGINHVWQVLSNPQEWKQFVAVRCDIWLLAMSFHFASDFNKRQKAKLFSRINSLPTILQEVRTRRFHGPALE